MTNRKILCVDDDEKILKGIQRQLGDEFEISVAVGPLAALEMIEEEGPYAVVVSDMRMPEMNGVELLKRIRERTPDTVRMILTGFAELNSTIDAVNKGHIFRFLAKPCSAEDMASSLHAGLKQYGLVAAEKELVEGTLRGSVKVLSDVLSLVSPLAFGQSTRVRTTVDGILKRFKIEDQWQVEIAAMLSSLGCVTLPAELLQKKFAGEPLTRDEDDTFSEHPTVAKELLSSIPRLERVADIVGHQNVPTTESKSGGQTIHLESRILKLAIEFDMHEAHASSSLHALEQLSDGPEQFDSEMLNALSEYIKEERCLQFAELMVSDLEEGMVLAEDVKDSNGTLLMSKGQRISSSAFRLLTNFSRNKSIDEPIKVVLSTRDCEVSTV